MSDTKQVLHRNELPAKIELWTWLTPDFDLLSGKVDVSLSEFSSSTSSTATYRKCHANLAECLRTEQMIWCSLPTKEPWSHSDFSRPRVLWVLNLPINSILAVVDQKEWAASIESPENQLSIQRILVPRDEWDRIPTYPSCWTADPSIRGSRELRENFAYVMGHPVQPEWVLSRNAAKSFHHNDVQGRTNWKGPIIDP